MRIPKRKSEEAARLKRKTDYHLTVEKIERMKKTFKRLKEIERPIAIQEMQRTAEMGDFSENAGYQDAKRRLRRINSRLLSLEDKISHAIPITVGKSDEIQIGSCVSLEIENREIEYRILGSAESNPMSGKISYSSPLGATLIGKKVGDEVSIGEKVYKIIKIK